MAVIQLRYEKTDSVIILGYYFFFYLGRESLCSRSSRAFSDRADYLSKGYWPVDRHYRRGATGGCYTTVLIERDWQGLKQGVFTGIAAAGSMLILKYSVSELRPDHSNYHSFPSGHSTIAFASAAFMQRRYGWKWGIPAYTVATYTAVGRVLAKKHHWWDCVAGAAIGAASAYIFTTPWAREHEFSMAPVATDSAVGLTLSMSL